ncbi:hypothetical protein AB1L12_13600 [Peribacillus frigoritolerans]|uniref:lipopolysaccharide biosynthesis protein n=1 Tax=Peribacillus frigoritolerans TaxID=450367 RepID=UPI0039A3970F
MKQYGSEYFGLVSSTQQILVYFTIFEAGIGAASIQALYKSLADNDYKRTNAILITTKKFYNRAALLYSIGLIILAFVYPLILKGQISQQEVILLVLVMGTSGVVEFLIQGKYRVLLTADQKLSTLNNFICISQLVGLLIRVVLIVLGYDIVLVQASFTVVTIIRAVWISVYVRKKYKYINFTSDISDPINQRKAVIIQQLAGLVVYNTPTLFLTIFTDLKTVSLYAVYNFVFSSLYSILTYTFSVGVTASFGNLGSNKDLKSLQINYNIYEFGYYLLFTVIYTVTAVMIIPFVKLYTMGVDDIQYVNYKIAFLFIIIGLLNNIRVPMITMISAMGHFEQTKYRALTEAIINVSVSLLLVFFIGIYGVLVGTIVSFLYRTLDMIIYTNKNILNQTLLVTTKRIVVNISSASVVCFVVFNFMDNVGISINSWWNWILVSIMTTIFVGMFITITNCLVEPSTCKTIINKFLILKQKRKGLKI